MVASLRSQSSLEILLASLGSSAAIAATGCAASFALIGLTSRCFVPQFTMVALQRLTACNAPLFIGLPLRLFRALRAAKLRPTGRALRAPPATATSSIRNGRAAALTGSLATLPCLLGLLRPASATGGGLRAPLPVSAKILRIFGRGNCKEAIFALENGIFRRGVLRVHAPLNSAWSSHCARRLACGTPCFIGLTSRCFAHRARASCAPRRTRRRGRLKRERASAFSCAPSGFFDSRSI